MQLYPSAYHSASPLPQVLTPLRFRAEWKTYKGTIKDLNPAHVLWAGKFYSSWSHGYFLFVSGNLSDSLLSPNELNMTSSPVFRYPIIVSTFLPPGLSLSNQVALLNQDSRLFLWLSYMVTSTYRKHSCIPRPGQLWISKSTPLQTPLPTATGLFHFLHRSSFQSPRHQGAHFKVSESSMKVLFTRLAVGQVAYPLHPLVDRHYIA